MILRRFVEEVDRNDCDVKISDGFSGDGHHTRFGYFPSSNNQEIELLREQVDSVDNQMIELLAKRMELIEKIGLYKKDHGIAIFQLRRWEQIIRTRNDFGKSLGLDEAFIKKMLQLIHKESIMRQNRLINKNGE